MNTPVSHGVLAIWHDLEPTSEAESQSLSEAESQGLSEAESQDLCETEFQQWHTREHMAERLSVPGFLRGCRYVAVNSSPRVFNFYLTESPDVLTSRPYLDRLNNPSEWTARVVPTLRNVNRSAGRVVASVGMGQGGAIATLQVSPLPDRCDCFETWLVETGLQQSVDLPGIVAAHLWKTDSAVSSVETAESRARGDSADIADWTLAIEGNDVEFVRSASDWLQDQKEFTSALQERAEAGIYRLQHHLDAQSVDSGQ